MRAFLLIVIIVISTLLSCGIFGPDDSVRVYDIVEVKYRTMQEWIEYAHVYEIEGFDWPEKIELVNYEEGQEIKGRVKMHYLGWLPIDDISIDGYAHFRVFIDSIEIYLLSEVQFHFNIIEQNQIKGKFVYYGPTLPESLGNPYRATR